MEYLTKRFCKFLSKERGADNFLKMRHDLESLIVHELLLQLQTHGSQYDASHIIGLILFLFEFLSLSSCGIPSWFVGQSLVWTSSFFSFLRIILKFRDQSMKLVPLNLSFSGTNRNEKGCELFDVISIYKIKYARLDMRSYVYNPTIQINVPLNNLC